MPEKVVTAVMADAAATIARPGRAIEIRFLAERICSRLDPRTRGGLHRVLPGATILLTLIGIWAYGATVFFVPCLQDCGEAFDALQYVDNYRLYGFQYGLVQDMATSPSLDARPFLYTHNVNVAGIIFTILDAIGLWPFWTKQLVTLAGFGAGLLYVYRATVYHTRSRLAGTVVLALFVTDVQHVVGFGLNPLRAWQILPIFGLLLHVGQLAQAPRRSPGRHRLAIVLLACLAFGIGYDFWVTCAALAAGVQVIGRGRRAFSRGTVVAVAGLVVAFAVPFGLRQVQIALVLGPSFWLMDVVYSAAIKVSVLSRFVAVPSTAELDEIYRAAGVYRPPATPAPTINSILITLADMSQYIVLPSYGTLPIALVVAVSVLSVAATILLLIVQPRPCIQLLARCGLVGARRTSLVGAVRMVAALVLAIVGGLAVFAPLSLHIYLKHEFPLVVGPILLVKGLILAAAASFFWQAGARRSPSALVALGIASLLILDHLVVQAANAQTHEPMALSWIPALNRHRESAFAVSWIPSSVSTSTDTWAIGIAPGKEREVADRLARDQPLFTPTDFFLFGERDAQRNESRYVQPDFWLYYRTDRLREFDHPQPVCHQDYLGRILSRLRGGGDDVTQITQPFAQPGAVAPGKIVTFGVQIARSTRPGMSAELLLGDQVVGPLNYNCQYGTVLGEYRVPTDSPTGMQTFALRLALPGSQTIPLGEISVMIDPKATAETPRIPTARPPQPSVDEMIRLFPGLLVAERGADYVIFDLRRHFGRT